MRRAGLIVNPKAGRGQIFARRSREMARIFAALGFEMDVSETTAAPESARTLAARAAERCEIVIACGGDGTVHEVLQGVARTQACLGVLPFGTANALARNLGLPLDPVAALNKLLGYTATEIPLGLAVTGVGERWFTVMAGAGPDGTLVHEMKLGAKARVGRGAYYAEAARLYVSRRFAPFHVEYKAIGSSEWASLEAVAMMASRISNLGGLFRGLTQESRLHHPQLIVKLLAEPAHVSLPAWIAMGRVGLGPRNPWLTTLAIEELRCSPLKLGVSTYAQVDGEAVGKIPMRLRIVKGAVRMLMP